MDNKTTLELKEARRKDYLRMILIKTYGNYSGIENHVNQAYERCLGMDY